MNTRTLIGILTMFIFSAFATNAQKKVTVEALNEDISYNLDLKAVASVFADSRDPEDFEMRLNDYDSQISNLDLNNDGQIDYLRVVELKENNVNLVVIQAVVGYDLYQDVATIVVDRKSARRTHVQIIGDPYIYGANYIIEPVYVHTPVIFSFFRGPHYYRWQSPYYWGYYPSYYHVCRPQPVYTYVNHIHVHVNSYNRYNYTTVVRNREVGRLRSAVGRSDYATENPNSSFTSRTGNSVRNKHDLVGSSSRASTRTSSAGNNSSAVRSGASRSSSTMSDTGGGRSGGSSRTGTTSTTRVGSTTGSSRSSSNSGANSRSAATSASPSRSSSSSSGSVGGRSSSNSGANSRSAATSASPSRSSSSSSSVGGSSRSSSSSSSAPSRSSGSSSSGRSGGSVSRR